MNKRLRILCAILAMLQWGRINAQQAVSSPSLGTDLPTSPQAESIKKLGEFSVDNAYGQPDITIPLWEIDQLGYKIPLVLRYQASPMKPGYNYDVYGLGWSLTGSSCVSRNIKGIADEEASGRFELESFYNSTGTRLKNYSENSDNFSNLNTGYDEFTVTLPSGRTIPFYITLDSQKRLIYNVFNCDKYVRIACNFTTQNGSSDKRIMRFKVIDENGVVYNFNKPEKGQNRYQNEMSNVSWLLTSVEVPNKGIIRYEYTDEVTIYTYTKDEPILEVSRWSNTNATDMYCQSAPFTLSHSFSMQNPTYRMHFLKSITYGPTCVSFDYKSDGKHLKAISVTDEDSQIKVVKTFIFDITDSKLCKLTITGQKDTDTDRLAYRFVYQNSSPGDFTDYWGNRGWAGSKADIGNFNIRVDKGIGINDLNGAIIGDGSVTHIVGNQSYDIKSFTKINIQKSTSGDGRRASGPNYHGVLQKIIYPNGGYTLFEFENHKFLTANNEFGDLELNRRKQRVIEGGGFRIKKISNYTADNRLADYKEYKYGYTVDYVEKNNLPFPKMQKVNSQTHTGLGEAVVDPNLLTFMEYETSSYLPAGFMEMMMNKHLVGYPTFENPNAEILSTNGRTIWWYKSRFSALYFRQLLGGRPAVVYPEITIYHGKGDSHSENIGKTVLVFENIYGVFNSNLHYLTEAEADNQQGDTLYFEPVMYQSFNHIKIMQTMEYPEKRGRLRSKAEYVVKQVYANSFADILSSKEEYSYKEETMSNSWYKYFTAYSFGHGDIHSLQESCGTKPENLFLRDFYYYCTSKRGSYKLQETTSSISRFQSGTVKSSVKNSYAYGDAIRQTNYWNLSNKKNSYVYSADSAGYSSIYTDLLNRNILTLPLEESTYDLGHPDQRPAVSFKTEYAYFGNSILPKRIYAYNQKGYEGVYEVVSYTEHGKPQEVIDLRTGVHTTYLWGYSGRYMIARIQNATYSQVMAALSNSGKANACIDDVRKSGTLYNTMIESWTCLPLVGIKTYTDQTGMTTVYEYDGLGRLKSDGIQYSGGTELKHSYEYNFLNK